MVVLTSKEAKEKFGVLLDTALREPVMITRHGRASVVVVSADLYARLEAREPGEERVSARGFLSDLPGFGTEEFMKSKQEEIELEEEKFERRSRKTEADAA